MAIVDITHNQYSIGNSAIAVYRHFKQRLSIKNSKILLGLTLRESGHNLLPTPL
jgi:predicted HTH transcriptional regulator